MDDLIRREDVLDFLQIIPIDLGYREIEDVRTHVKCLPAVDAVEVKHGHWMTTDAFPHHVYCSECHKTYIPNDRWQVWQDVYGDGGLPRDYCPNCGARMDGRGEDGDA